MRTLIILKGLVKSQKLNWVKDQELDNYFLDIEVIRKMYSNPDLLSPGREVLGKSFGDTVYKRFLEIVNTRMSKGCLVVIDVGIDSTSIFETFALIYGYTVFYVVQNIPQDYLSHPKSYCIPYYPVKKRTDLEKEVSAFMNLQLGDKLKVNSYKEILQWWEKKFKSEQLWCIGGNDKVLHVSDLHSNTDLLEKLPGKENYSLTVFHGDYIDGPVKGGSRKLIDHIVSEPPSTNTIYLEGNHEIRLRRYLGWILLKGAGKKEATDLLYNSIPQEFLDTTASEFSGLGQDTAREYLEALNSKLKMFAIIDSPGATYYCTHSGLLYKEQLDPRYVGNLIYGNRDMNRFDRSFSEFNKRSGIWSVHAHCKYPDAWEPQRFPRVINLDPPSEDTIVYGEQINNKWNICLLEK